MDSNNKIDVEHLEEVKDEIIALKLALNRANSELQHEKESHAKIINRLSHDLKNPVGIIYSFIEMILEHGDTYDKEKMQKYLNVIKNSASFSIDLLNNLAKYSNLLSIEADLFKEKTNITKLTTSVVQAFSGQLKGKNISLIKEFTHTPLYLNIDAHEIEIALTNILSNAIRFSDLNTSIFVKVIENDSWVELEIKDQGMGIPEQFISKIFDEFFTINTYSEDKQKCVGLGLTIAQKIVQLHNGKITVKSLRDQGSVFTIKLPKD